MFKKAFKIVSLMAIAFVALSSCNQSEETESQNDFASNDTLQVSEVQSKLGVSEMLGVQKSVITCFYGAHTRAENLMSEGEAKKIFEPLIEDGNNIRAQIQESVQKGEFEMSELELQQLSEMTDEQLAQLSFVIYNIENPATMEMVFNMIESQWQDDPILLDEPTAYTRAQLLDCLSFAIGLDAVSGLWGYISGTAGLITAKTAWGIAAAFIGRTLGWVGLAYTAYQYADCLHSKYGK